MAGQSHVDQAGDHHSDPEHPPGGQEQEGEEVAHHLRGHEARGEPETGDHTETPECDSEGSQTDERQLPYRWLCWMKHREGA